MKKQLFSVVIPTYNEERDISGTLKAIKKARPDAEIIICDGHSKDNTIKIARKYTKNIYFNPTNVIAGARNEGMQHAHGQIILFNDADTKPTKKYFHALEKAFKNKKVVAAGCMIVPEKLNFLEKLFFYFLNFLVYFSVLIRRPCIAGSSVAYRARIIKKIKGFRTDMAASEDMDASIRASKLGKVVFFPTIVAWTSNRRFKEEGFGGLIKDWGHTTINFLLGIKTKKYKLYHGK